MASDGPLCFSPPEEDEMIQTYRALLQGNRLEWLEEIPELITEETSIPVQVTIDTQAATKEGSLGSSVVRGLA
jgi:hypothetical protein